MRLPCGYSYMFSKNVSNTQWKIYFSSGLQSITFGYHKKTKLPCGQNATFFDRAGLQSIHAERHLPRLATGPDTHRAMSGWLVSGRPHFLKPLFRDLPKLCKVVSCAGKTYFFLKMYRTYNEKWTFWMRHAPWFWASAKKLSSRAGKTQFFFATQLWKSTRRERNVPRPLAS